MILLLTLPTGVCAADWQWITPQRASTLVKEGSGLWLVDVRSEAAFAEGHIEGAVNVPAGILAAKRLPKDKIIVLVDDSLGVRKGREAAELLRKKGHEKLYVLDGGMPVWQNENYPVAGQGSRQRFRSVMPEDTRWAAEKRIPMMIYDLRDQEEQGRAPLPQAQAVAGKSLAERLEKVKEMVQSGAKKGFAAKLETPPAVVLVFPTAADPRTALEGVFRGFSGDIRFMEGGYVAWAAKPDKAISAVGTCPTCAKRASGGKK